MKSDRTDPKLAFHLVDVQHARTPLRDFGSDGPSDWLYMPNQRSVDDSRSWINAGDTSGTKKENGDDVSQVCVNSSSVDSSTAKVPSATLARVNETSTIESLDGKTDLKSNDDIKNEKSLHTYAS